MTSSNGNIFRVTGPLCGEFTGPGEFPTQRPVTRSFDVFFDLRLNKRWVNNRADGDETPSWSFWRHRNVLPLTCHDVSDLVYLVLHTENERTNKVKHGDSPFQLQPKLTTIF